MCHGKNASKKAEIKAIFLLSNNSLTKKYSGNTVSAPKNAEGNLTANSFTPKMNVDNPENQKIPIGRKSPNLLKYKGKIFPNISCPCRTIYLPTYPAYTSSVWRLNGKIERLNILRPKARRKTMNKTSRSFLLID